MRHVLYAVAVLCLFLASPKSKADTVFTLQDATFKSGAVATGNIRIDVVTGAFVSAEVTYQLSGFSALFNGPFLDGGTVFDDQIFSYVVNDNGDLLLLDLPVTSLVNYTGGPICSDAALCDDFRGYVQLGFDPIDQFTTGSLVPVAPTPEPSTLLLLSTAISICPVLRSRLQGASRV